jgi:hypothetical protein
MKIRFVGDVHGKIGEYLAICSECKESVQVGDMGLGFKGVYLPHDEIMNHRFIRGNHDDPNACAVHPYWIPDGSYDYEKGIMYIGGAWSIDHAYRIEGVSWWRDEEVSTERLYEMIDFAERVKPKIMITHDFPEGVITELFFNTPIRTRTQSALEMIRQVIKPELWIGGHWHFSVDKVIDGTRFICLNELQYIDLEI